MQIMGDSRLMGMDLHPLSHLCQWPAPSVKSCLLLAGLYRCRGALRIVVEPAPTPAITRKRIAQGLWLSGHFKRRVRGTCQGDYRTGPKNSCACKDFDVASGDFFWAFFIGRGQYRRGSGPAAAACGINPTRIGVINYIARHGRRLEPGK